LDAVRPVAEVIAVEDEAAVLHVRTAGDVAAVELPAHAVEDGWVRADREPQRRESGGADRVRGRALRVEAGGRQLGAEGEGGEDERPEHGGGDRQAVVAAKDAAPFPACRGSGLLFRLGVVAVVRRRSVGGRLGPQALDLADQEQDRAARRLELGARLVLRELLPPAAELVDLSCIHPQSMTGKRRPKAVRPC
jgi:hypothetical protein